MTFFPSDFDPRDERLGLLDLVSLNTPDGTARFWIGGDGVFTDSSGEQWFEKRAKVGDALRGGISWRCSDAVNSLSRKGYAT
ncbi:hypothetical protein SAMN05444415_1081, partial [Salipiger profundus]